MDVHRGCETGIVHLDTRYVRLYNKLSPHTIDLITIRQQDHSSFNRSNLLVDRAYCQPEPIPFNRSRHYVPELGNVLSG